MQNTIRLGRRVNFNKNEWINSRLQNADWKIQYNEFGMKTEAEAISKALSEYTGLAESVFPCSIGLPKPKDLKIWFGDRLLWNYVQIQRLPTSRELVEQIGSDKHSNWKVK